MYWQVIVFSLPVLIIPFIPLLGNPDGWIHSHSDTGADKNVSGD